MSKFVAIIAALMLFVPSAQARQNYSLDQVQAGTLSWVNTFYPDAPADGFKREGNLHCSGQGTPRKFACEIEIKWRNDMGNVVARDDIGLTERIRIKGNCRHGLYRIPGKGWRARVRIPVRYATNRGCIIFKAKSPQFATRQEYK